MKTKALLLSAILFFGLFFVGNGSAGSQVFAEEAIPFERMKAFFNSDRSATTLQCYQVAIPNGWEAETFLVWLDPLEESGFSRSKTQDDIVCFVLNPGEVKWLFTKVKRTGSFNNNGVLDIKYGLCLKEILYSNDNTMKIDVHRRKAPMII